MTDQLNQIRDRANSVLDGMTRHREQVAKDCLLLCAAVERLNRTLAEREPAKHDTSVPDFLSGLFR